MPRCRAILNIANAQLRFTLKLPFILRDHGFLATFVIVTPILRQIEPRIDQRCHVTPAQSREDTHLTVIDFPQTTIPLPGNAGRCLAFLGKTAFIKNQYRVGSAQQRVGFLGNLSTKPLPINASFCQHMLHGWVINLINFAHAQHVGPFGLE